MPIDASIYMNQPAFDPFGSAASGYGQGMKIKDALADRERLARKDQLDEEMAKGAMAKQQADQQRAKIAADKEKAAMFAPRVLGLTKENYALERPVLIKNGIFEEAELPENWDDNRIGTVKQSVYSVQQLLDKEKQAREQGNSDREFNLKKNKDQRDARSAGLGDNKTIAETGKIQAESAPGSKEYKKEQYDAGGFAKRLEQAEGVFGSLEKSGYDRTSRVEEFKAKWAPGELQGSGLKQQEQAERNFVNAVLRRESGASISPTEFSSAEQQYFPRPGDPPEVKAQKLANRQQAFESIKAAAGGAYNQIPTVSTPSSGFKMPSVSDIDAELARRK